MSSGLYALVKGPVAAIPPLIAAADQVQPIPGGFKNTGTRIPSSEWTPAMRAVFTAAMPLARAMLKHLAPETYGGEWPGVQARKVPGHVGADKTGLGQIAYADDEDAYPTALVYLYAAMLTLTRDFHADMAELYAGLAGCECMPATMKGLLRGAEKSEEYRKVNSKGCTAPHAK